jgi:hypothetical protein
MIIVGKQITTETKLRIHNITSKAALFCIINKRDAQKLEAAQMRFLRPLVGLTRLYPQRNPDIRNRLNVINLTEDIKLYQKSLLDCVEITDRSP